MAKTEDKKNNLTKQRIINSAIFLFATKGYDSTSTREICKMAEVNLSMISYYFKTKELLYINIIESIVDYGMKYMELELEKVKLLSKMNTQEKITTYKKILEMFISFLYSEKVPNNFVILMIKEQANTNSKFGGVYAKKINILYSALRKILASIKNRKETDKSIIFDVSTIVGQILSFKIMRLANLSALKQKEYTSEDRKKITKIILSLLDLHIQNLETIV